MKEQKTTIGWTLENLEGINLIICMHQNSLNIHKTNERASTRNKLDHEGSLYEGDFEIIRLKDHSSQIWQIIGKLNACGS